MLLGRAGLYVLSSVTIKRSMNMLAAATPYVLIKHIIASGVLHDS
jgi:hypothetical protein